MQKKQNSDVEFKSLLTEEEYNLLIDAFPNSKTDTQTNHYFDTPRFSLKALDASLRVRERNDYSLTYKRKKGYSIDVNTVEITKEDFEKIKETGVVHIESIANELANVIKDQKVYNFLSLSTFRTYLPYKEGVLNIDRSSYCDVIDYEVEYSSKSYHQGREIFINFINEYGIKYKKSDKKIKRAFTAYRNEL